MKTLQQKRKNHSRNVLNKNRAFAILGSKCIKCGETDPQKLQIDHINGGGAKEIKRIATWGIYAKVIKGQTSEYQLLCASCNWKKRFEQNEVSHGQKYQEITQKQTRILKFVGGRQLSMSRFTSGKLEFEIKR